MMGLRTWWGRLSLQARLAGAFGLMATSALVFLLALQARTLGAESLARGKIVPATVAVLVAFFIGAWVVAGWCLEAISRLGRRINEPRPTAGLPAELAGLAALLRAEAQRRDRLLAELRQFTADASHELRTPLTAMRTAGEVALRQQSADTVALRDGIASMLEEVQRMNQLIDRLLLLARMEGDGLSVQLRRAPLAELLAGFRDSVAPLAEEKNVVLEVHCPADLHTLVDADVLRHVILNLAQNAIDHAPPGTRVRWLARTADDAVDTAWIDVVDEGPGVPPEHRTRVFERFARADAGRGAGDGGAGLGLCIARAAAERMGGGVMLLDAPPPGACFRVVLRTDHA
jgi:signal transduction histidine kinase